MTAQQVPSMDDLIQEVEASKGKMSIAEIARKYNIPKQRIYSARFYRRRQEEKKARKARKAQPIQRVQHETNTGPALNGEGYRDGPRQYLRSEMSHTDLLRLVESKDRRIDELHASSWRSAQPRLGNACTERFRARIMHVPAVRPVVSSRRQERWRMPAPSRPASTCR